MGQRKRDDGPGRMVARCKRCDRTDAEAARVPRRWHVGTCPGDTGAAGRNRARGVESRTYAENFDCWRSRKIESREHSRVCGSVESARKAARKKCAQDRS